MPIRKFKVTVRREDEYIVEIDDAIYNEEWFEDFRKVFYPFTELEEIAGHLAQYQARFGQENDHRFIEGFGAVTRDGKMPYSYEDYDGKGKQKPESKLEKPAKGLNIVIVDEENEIETDVEEIVEKGEKR